MNASIAKDTRSIERMSTRAGELSAQIAGASKSSAALAAASKKQMNIWTGLCEE